MSGLRTGGEGRRCASGSNYRTLEYTACFPEATILFFCFLI